MSASRGTLKFHTVVTIHNGVELTEENIGRMVEMTMVLKNWATGAHHKTHFVTATYVGNTYEFGPDAVFAHFNDAIQNGKPLGEFGTPLAFFR